MKKNTKSSMKKEQSAKRVKAQRPVQREPKEVLAELVEKLQGKLAVLLHRLWVSGEVYEPLRNTKRTMSAAA